MHDSIRRLLDNVLESDIRDRSSVTVEKRRESADSTAYTIRVENLAANTESFNSNSPHVDIDYVQSASPGLNVEPAIVRIGVRSIEDQTMVEQKIQVLTYPVDEAPYLKAPSKKIVRVPEDSHTTLSFEMICPDDLITFATLGSENSDANATFTFLGAEENDDIEIVRPEDEINRVLIRGSGASIRDALKNVVYRAQTPDFTGSDTVRVNVQDSERIVYIVVEPINDPPIFQNTFSSSLEKII